ncbi:drebrin-like protein [Rhopalosiphum maidis]|uniref:drebrin-like protein n=1 Tax=Rhopalosiphum maidis TaxID=43146 RepID=UPI000EFFFC89|nr:drebrin-like protein [Rhopalosiphum maidis]
MSQLDANKNRQKILDTWKDVVDDKTPTNWALYGYEGPTNVLKFISQGEGGIEEMKEDLNSSKIMYAFCRVLDPKTSLYKCVLINWQGEGAPIVRKGTCANHIRDVSNILKGAHVTINARNDDEVDTDIILSKVSKSSGSVYSFKERLDQSQPQEKIGTTYKRIQPNLEINSSERDKFWAAEEEKEKLRQEEERKKKEQEQKKIEDERLLREDADRLRRDSITVEEIQKTESKPFVATTEPEIPKDVKIELAKPGLVTEEIENQNKQINVEDDLGIKAEALYDYQAADDTEISFDPGDIICHIDKIDQGWWQGLSPDGTFGLFPANYVQLLP